MQTAKDRACRRGLFPPVILKTEQKKFGEIRKKDDFKRKSAKMQVCLCKPFPEVLY
ncbi:MAG: hypothetical protein IJN20_01025 [Oscillospiraceae bacterium]|nr:hypothetical protein [Oscillospiraceae bacterium]